MTKLLFDLEGDGLFPSKIHCFSYSIDCGPVKTLTDYNEIRELLKNKYTLVGHNIIMFDIPVLERLLDVDLTHHNIIDTLPLSWYLYIKRPKHGLESWSHDLGTYKPEIEDWVNLPITEYINRCENDVKTQIKLWERFEKHIVSIYDTTEQIGSLIKYLNFKMKCVSTANKLGWKLDVYQTKKNLDELQAIIDEKEEKLKSVMPEVPKYTTKTKPKSLYKKDGSYTVYGSSWFALLNKENLPKDYDGEIKVVQKYEEPNPRSHDQVKKWLSSLGWEPCTFKTNDKGNEVPQITVLDGPELTPSVQELVELYEELKEYEGYTIACHRRDILQGFLDCVDKKGFLHAEIGGFTNTLRLKHKKPLVNLPTLDTQYGEYIRPCLSVPDDFILCGADMSGLEDRTKQHYIYKFDPEYVEEMRSDDWDPHLDLGLKAGMIDEESVLYYKTAGHNEQHSERYGVIKGLRRIFKTSLYALTYGAFPAKIAKTAKVTIEKASELFEAYWKRNWAIKETAEECFVKYIEFEGEKQMWLLNPVNNLYYPLKKEKDRFSTLNQGTGSYCFDTWIGFVLQAYPIINAQFHDEGVWCIPKEDKEKLERILRESIDKTNAFLNLNIALDIDIKFGHNYGEVH